MKKLIIGKALFILTLSGCSTFNNSKLEALLGRPESHREFFIHRDWIKPTLSFQNERIRKINRMSPLLTQNLVIQGNGHDGIVAFQKETGKIQWRLPLPHGVEAEGITYKNRIYLAATDGKILSLNGQDGHILWSLDSKSENLSQPLLDNDSGTLFVLTGNNSLIALDASNGASKWIYSRQDPSSFSIRGGTQPILKDSVLYVGFSEGSLVALNAKTGTVAWEISLNKNKRFRDIDATVVIDQDKLFVSGFDDKLYALSLKGDILWKFDDGGYTPVKILEDQLFYSSTSGNVYSLNKHTGQVQWTYQLKTGLATEPQIFKGLLCFGESQGGLVFLNRIDGSKVGSLDPGRGIMAKPSFDENKIYFISGEANLYALTVGWRLKQGYF